MYIASELMDAIGSSVDEATTIHEAEQDHYICDKSVVAKECQKYATKLWSTIEAFIQDPGKEVE